MFNNQRFWLQTMGPVLLLAVWTVCSATDLVPVYLLPPPWTVLKAMLGFVTGLGWHSPYAGGFLIHAATSLARVLSGFTIAAIMGITLGIACGRSQRLAWLIDPLVQLFRSVPGISWLPIAMIWFGIGTSTAIFLIALAAFFPVYINTLHGARDIPQLWLRAARTLGASSKQVLFRVVLPGVFPSIESGLRVGMGVAWAYVVLGELTGVNKGLGAMIMDARMMGDATTIFVGMAYIALLGCLTDRLLMSLFKHIRGHRPCQRT